MCGIVGSLAIGRGRSTPLNLSALGHRGPDGHGQVSIGPVRLGHTRLSIIDLAGGTQPMRSREAPLTIVFNGEIYNYRALRTELVSHGRVFATASDTEVVLAAYLTWGVSGFARLRGMFAAALADERTGELVLARDPFGIKPLFWHADDSAVSFASETGVLRGMIGKLPSVDPTSVLETLMQRYPCGEATLYRGIGRVAPGTVLTIDHQGRVRESRFASVAGMVETHRRAAGESGPEACRHRVSDSVAHHVIADVPVGTFLSGGLDSGIVAAEASRLTSGPLHAYSVGFADTSSEASELPFASVMAKSIGARLTAIEVTADDFVDLAPRLSQSGNGPFPDPADVAMLKMALIARADVKVVLSGEGADEAFAGYPKYAFDRLIGPAARGLARLMPGRLPGRLAVAARALGESDRARRWSGWFANDAPPPALVAALIDMGAQKDRALDWTRDRIASYPKEWSNLQRMQVLDCEGWLPNYLLHRGDYTTMKASLEQRVPFLDSELTPWAIALPDSAKIARFRGKQLLRSAYADRLPRPVVKRRKSGFRMPLGEWISRSGRLRDAVYDTLNTRQSALAGLMGRNAIDPLIQSADASSIGGAKLIWTAYSLELWLRSLAI